MENVVFGIIIGQTRKVMDIRDILDNTEKHFGSEVFELKGGYGYFVSTVQSLCQKGIIQPVKSSGGNGRNPTLYNKYRILHNVKDSRTDEMMLELQSLHPKLEKGYYYRNPDSYKKDRHYILMLSDYLLGDSSKESLKCRCTMNERSFEIFNNEKFLGDEGKVILRRLGMSLEELNCYKTVEAFFLYSF